MTIVIVFKTGFELKIKCEEFKLKRNNLTGQIIGYTAKGVTENNPIDIDFDNILCVYRVLSDEINNQDD